MCSRVCAIAQQHDMHKGLITPCKLQLLRVQVEMPSAAAAAAFLAVQGLAAQHGLHVALHKAAAAAAAAAVQGSNVEHWLHAKVIAAAAAPAAVVQGQLLSTACMSRCIPTSR
jgi:hypothetical protein